MPGKPTRLDRGWAWVVLGAAAFNLCVELGISLGSGVYVAEVIKNWEVSKANAALLGSVLYGIMFCFGPITTFLATKTSNRAMVILGGLLSSVGLVASANVTGIVPLYFTFSVMGGIGNGMVFLQSIVMVNLYFKKYRGLASGITLAGGGMGLLVIPLLERKLISYFSWQPSLYIVAGICLQTCVTGALMRPVNIPINTDIVKSIEDNVYVSQGQSLHRNIPFVFFCVSSFIWGLAVTAPIILGSDFYEDSGMNGFQINILLSCFGVGNLIGRLIGGIICNIRAIDKLLLYSIATTIVGVNIGLFTLTTDFTYLVVLASFFGFNFGFFIVSHTVASATVVEASKIESSITVSYFINGIALVIGPPIAGKIDEIYTFNIVWKCEICFRELLWNLRSCLHNWCTLNSHQLSPLSSGMSEVSFGALVCCGVWIKYVWTFFFVSWTMCVDYAQSALFDLTRSYRWPFLVSAVTMIVAALIVLPGFWCRRSSTAMALYIEAEKTNPDEKLNSTHSVHSETTNS